MYIREPFHFFNPFYEKNIPAITIHYQHRIWAGGSEPWFKGVLSFYR